MAKHIPGPWISTPGLDIRTLSDDRFVASVFGRGKDEEQATSWLIAAAPQLLNALRQVEPVAQAVARGETISFSDATTMLEIIDSAIAAAEEGKGVHGGA